MPLVNVFYTKGTLPALVSWDNSITVQVAAETSSRGSQLQGRGQGYVAGCERWHVWNRGCRVVMRIRPELFLRLGCGCVNLYAGFFLLTDSARFYKYVPFWLSGVASAVASVDAYLRLQG